MPDALVPFLGPIVGVLFVAVGLGVARTPVDQLLEYDRRLGRWLYDNAPDEATGRQRAARFYRAFGFGMAGFGLLFGLLFGLFGALT
jgi:hypothetical protein